MELLNLLSRDDISPRWTLAANNIARDTRQACLSDTAALPPLSEMPRPRVEVLRFTAYRSDWGVQKVAHNN